MYFSETDNYRNLYTKFEVFDQYWWLRTLQLCHAGAGNKSAGQCIAMLTLTGLCQSRANVNLA